MVKRVEPHAPLARQLTVVNYSTFSYRFRLMWHASYQLGYTEIWNISVYVESIEIIFHQFHVG